jgi:hypothetical protein
VSAKVKIVEEGMKIRSLVHITSKGGGVCWNSRMGIRTSDKRINYSHELAQTKQQVS